MRKAARRRAPTRGCARPCGGVVVPRVLRDVLDGTAPRGVPAIGQEAHLEEFPQLVGRGLPDGHLRIRTSCRAAPPREWAPPQMQPAARPATKAWDRQAAHAHSADHDDHIDLGVRRDPGTNSESLLARHLGIQPVHDRCRARIKRCVLCEWRVPHARRRKERRERKERCRSSARASSGIRGRSGILAVWMSAPPTSCRWLMALMVRGSAGAVDRRYGVVVCVGCLASARCGAQHEDRNGGSAPETR